VSELTLAHAREYADGMALVSDAEILEAARHLLLREKLVVEPSGAAAVAAVRSGKLRLPRGPAVCVLSGGNADVAMILGSGPGSAGSRADPAPPGPAGTPPGGRI
jgi:threonine dehydratase